jgi:HD-GYP domain-containing protein (c-di-GMP phosphodiesterase class II)
LRTGELVATLALAQDNAFGQPLESQLRSCLLAVWMSEAAGFDRELRETIYWVALLRYVGCTGHTHEVASLFGDDIAIRAQTLVHDTANPEEVVGDILDFATRGRSPEEREQMTPEILAGLPAWVTNFGAGCEVADMLVERLDFDADVRAALRFTFERWNGHGLPTGARGTDIPLAMRVVHLSHDMEAHGRLSSPDAALGIARARRDSTYDPDLVDLFETHGLGWFDQLAKLEPWDAVLELEPKPHRTLEGAELENALVVVADFVDLKSPYMNGHSRRCAELSEATARVLELGDDDVTTLRRAAWVHELGTTAIPNSIWDKTGPLTRAEFDRVERHPMLTEQMLRRSPALAQLNPIASAHHEKVDGSGYHKGLRVDAAEPAASVFAAVDIYVALTTDRADRPAFSPDHAAAELRRLTTEGRLDSRSTEAVLSAAGHGDQSAKKVPRQENPGGLTAREVEVLRLAARGLTTKTIAEQLFIAPKTADHHIENVYTKIGVSSRAAAALWAMQNALVH